MTPPFDASSLPLAVREREAEKQRREEPPGPRRVAIIRGLGFVPLPSDGDASRQAPVAKPAPRPSPHPDWDSFAARIRGTLEPGTDPLFLFLPGLRLRSENQLQRGMSGREDRTRREKPKSFIEVRHAAKSEAMGALMDAAPLRLWRFDVRVRIAVFQVDDDCRIDPGNLYAKALIDLLLARGGGLGVLHDDSRKWISFATTGYRGSIDGEVGVWIEIESEKEPAP